MKDRHLSEQSTIYNYTLLKKIPYSLYYQAVYTAILVLGALILALVYGPSAVIAIVFAYVPIQALHALLLRLLLVKAHAGHRNVWKLKLDFPVVGYLPEGFILAALFQRLHVHLTIIGAAVIGLAYVWIAPLYFYSLLFMHVWVLLPRLFHLWKFRKLKKSGLIKCNPLDMSYYMN